MTFFNYNHYALYNGKLAILNPTKLIIDMSPLVRDKRSTWGYYKTFSGGKADFQPACNIFLSS